MKEKWGKKSEQAGSIEKKSTSERRRTNLVEAGRGIFVERWLVGWCTEKTEELNGKNIKIG